jgi:hypothetical protein
MLPAEPGVDLDDELGLAGDAATVIVHRGNVLEDPGDVAIFRDEEHVEREAGVVHPERAGLAILEHEEHAAVFGELAAVHEAAVPVFFGEHGLGLDDRGPGGLRETELADGDRGGVGRVGRAARVGAWGHCGGGFCRGRHGAAFLPGPGACGGHRLGGGPIALRQREEQSDPQQATREYLARHRMLLSQLVPV